MARVLGLILLAALCGVVRCAWGDEIGIAPVSSLKPGQVGASVATMYAMQLPPDNHVVQASSKDALCTMLQAYVEGQDGRCNYNGKDGSNTFTHHVDGDSCTVDKVSCSAAPELGGTPNWAGRGIGEVGPQPDCGNAPGSQVAVGASGAYCQCNSGKDDGNHTSCKEKTDADCGQAGKPAGADGPGPNDTYSGSMQSACVQGCKYKGGIGVCAGSSCAVSGPFTQTGQACNSQNGSAPADPDQKSCAAKGQGVGTVNGVSTCVPATTSQKTTTTQTDKSDGKGGTSSSVTDKTTTDNGNGTSTTTTTTTNSDGSSTTRTTTVANGSGSGSGGSGGAGTGAGSCTGPDCTGTDFCVAHPSSIICKDSTFSGSCGAPFHCDGDAVQCAMATEQHQRYCQMMEPLTAGGEIQHQAEVGRQAGTDGDHPDWSPASPGQVANTTMDFASGLDQTNPWGGECPADQALDLGPAGHVTLPFSTWCSSFQLIGKLVLAVAVLGAAFIVFKS